MKHSKLRLHEDADRELNDAADYYDRESPGLGAVFLDEIETGYARILKHPEGAQQVALGIRKLVLARFPFGLVYEVRENEIRILAVAHQSRRPYYWRGRS